MDAFGANGLVGRAALIAATAYQGRLHIGGHSYISHAQEVAKTLSSFGPIFEATAWLHAVLDEGTDLTAGALGEKGIPALVTAALELMSSRESATKEDHSARLASNPVALIVRLAHISISKEAMGEVRPDEAEEITAQYDAEIARMARYAPDVVREFMEVIDATYEVAWALEECGLRNSSQRLIFGSATEHGSHFRFSRHGSLFEGSICRIGVDPMYSTDEQIEQAIRDAAAIGHADS